MRRSIAAAGLAFLVPADLFFAALFFRNFLPSEGPSNAPQQLVMWYAGRPWTLWILLIALPVLAFAIGAAVLWRGWMTDASLRRDAAHLLEAVRARLALVISGVATVSAAAVLLLVGLHMALS